MYDFIHNPYKLTLMHLHLLASYLNIPFLNLIYMIHNNKTILLPQDIEIINKLNALPTDLNEYTKLKPEHLK